MSRNDDDIKLPEWINNNIPDELISSSLFKFRITVQVYDDGSNVQTQKVIDVDMLPDLDVDMDIIEQQMQDIPSQYIYWSSIYSELRLAVAVSERNLKVRRGRATKFIQEEARKNNTRLSVEQIKVLVESDEKLIAADLRLARAQMLAGKLWHMLKALELKHENCRSLIGLKRAELEKS